MKTLTKTRQRGTTTVEFAIIGATLMLVLFGVIEIARALYIWNTIGEVTRRGARVATVCPVNHPGITQVAILGAPGGGSSSPILNNLTAGNIQVTYLDQNGAATANFPDIEYVRVGIVDYMHTLLIPFIPAPARTLEIPPFSTTLPAESLGFVPDTNDRRCFAPGI